MRRIASADLFACGSVALVRLAWALNCAPARKPGETDGAYRGRLVHAIQRAEKMMARSSAEAERVVRPVGQRRKNRG
jgi:hypothetical protein